jgi:hypothetical protein
MAIRFRNGNIDFEGAAGGSSLSRFDWIETGIWILDLKALYSSWAM